MLLGKVDVGTSPKKHGDTLTKSQTSLVKYGKLSIDSCNKGDYVLVIWDKSHQNYIILQESACQYFLHSDCLELLGLKLLGGGEQKMYCTGEVYQREFCKARKVRKPTVSHKLILNYVCFSGGKSLQRAERDAILPCQSKTDCRYS